MALLKKTTPVDDLNKQRSDLVRRLVDAQGVMQNADPVKDWERVSKATADVMALERAVTEIDKRIKQAEFDLRRATAEEREQAQAERKAQAQARILTLAQRMAGELLAAPWVREFDEAQQELAQAGEWLPPQAAPLLWVRQSVAAALEGWRDLSPTWVGLPEPPSREQQALAEAQRALADAEKRLDDARRDAQKPRRPGEAGPSSEEWRQLRTLRAHSVFAARRRLITLQQPDAGADDIFKRALTGLEELSEWAGEHYERRNRAARQQALA